MYVFPSNACNFRCSYCAQSLGQKQLEEEYALKREIMGMDVLKLAVEQAKEFPEPFKLASFVGAGEPLVNPKLAEMIDAAKSAGIAKRTDIITNGSLLTHQKSLELIESGLDVIRISVQGLSSKKYKEISDVSLDFDQYIENIDFFYRHRKNCKVYVKIADVSLEVGESDAFYQLFDSISDRMYVEKIKPVFDTVSYTQEESRTDTDRLGNPHERRAVCPQPFYLLGLWPNGDVAPCESIYKANPLGNIKKETLLQMWNSENLRSFQHIQLTGGRYKLPSCGRCCAPDDVSQPSDILDDDKAEILKRLF